MTTLIPKFDFKNGGTTPVGAINRDIDKKLGDIVSVKDFGAVGDAIHDDTAAIQAAIDFASSISGPLSSAVVYFPSNNLSSYYKITAPLVITRAVILQGSGPRGTTIYASGFTSGQYAIDMDNAILSNYFYGIKDINIDGAGVASGIKVKNCSYSNFENLWISNVLDGILITGTVCFNNYFNRVAVTVADSRGIVFSNYQGGGQNEFNECTFNAFTGFGFLSDSYTDGLVFINCNFEGCTTTELFIGGTVNGLSIVGCRTENFLGAVEFQINPTTGNSVGGIAITGCSFQAITGTAVPIQLGGAGGVVRGFTITGNRCLYAASPNFIVLNGEGESGLIAGNYTDYATTIVNAKRAGVIVFGNEYGVAGGGGKNTEAWGLADWAVAQNTWTPIDASGASLTFPNAAGIYQLVGNMVYFQGNVEYPTTASGSTAIIGGLPKIVYDGANNVGRSGAVINLTDSSATGMLFLTTTNTIRVQQGGFSNATNANLSGKVLYFSGMYRIA